MKKSYSFVQWIGFSWICLELAVFWSRSRDYWPVSNDMILGLSGLTSCMNAFQLQTVLCPPNIGVTFGEAFEIMIQPHQKNKKQKKTIVWSWDAKFKERKPNNWVTATHWLESKSPSTENMNVNIHNIHFIAIKSNIFHFRFKCHSEIFTTFRQQYERPWFVRVTEDRRNAVRHHDWHCHQSEVAIQCEHSIRKYSALMNHLLIKNM